MICRHVATSYCMIWNRLLEAKFEDTIMPCALLRSLSASCMMIFSDVRVRLPRRAREGERTDRCNESKSTRWKKKNSQGTCSSATSNCPTSLFSLASDFWNCSPRHSRRYHPADCIAQKHAQRSSGKLLFFFLVGRAAWISRQKIRFI